MVENQYIPDSVSPPGETLAELMAERGMSQVQLAMQLGRSRKSINEVLQGKSELTSDTAIQLEHVFHISAEFWTRREADYRAHLARRREAENLKRQAGQLLKGFPFKAMQNAGWIRAVSDRGEVLRELLTFFRVGTAQQLDPKTLLAGAAFRRPAAFKSEPMALAAWLRRGEMLAEAAGSALPPFDAAAFRDALKRMHLLTLEEPHVGIRRATAECLKHGVQVLVVPELRGARVSGAARWIVGRPVIQLSLRHKTGDHLWFTFFHEAGHILLHGKDGVSFVDEPDGALETVKEVEANTFAAACLLPGDAWETFVAAAAFDEASVRAFAALQRVAPGVIVGRLQHQRLASFTRLNGLKQRLSQGCLNG